MASQEMEQLVRREYKQGFVTDIESDTAPPGLNEDVIRFISAKKEEPHCPAQNRCRGNSHHTCWHRPRH